MWFEKCAFDYGFWGRYDPPNFGNLLLSFLVLLLSLLFALPGQAGTEVDTSAGDAKRG